MMGKAHEGAVCKVREAWEAQERWEAWEVWETIEGEAVCMVCMGDHQRRVWETIEGEAATAARTSSTWQPKGAHAGHCRVQAP